MIGRRREEAGEEEVSAGVAEEAAPEETQASAPEGEPETVTEPETEADDVDDTDDEEAEAPVADAMALGASDRYPNSSTRIDSCNNCGHNHAAGQFKTCQACGNDISFHA